MANANILNVDQAGIQTFNTSTGDLTGSATTQYNVLIGDTNNKLANVAPSATSGVPLISSGAAVNPAFGTAVVAGGGTGNTTFTAYSVICAGTTATGAFQNVSGVGTSGQALKSNGAGALPTWQNVTGVGYVLQMITLQGNPADSTTYYMTMNAAITASTTKGDVGQKLFVPISGTITSIRGAFTVTGALGSSQNVSLLISVNGGSSANFQFDQLNVAQTSFGGTVSTAVSAGDYIVLAIQCPAWTTNPTNVSYYASVLIT